MQPAAPPRCANKHTPAAQTPSTQTQPANLRAHTSAEPADPKTHARTHSKLANRLQTRTSRRHAQRAAPQTYPHACVHAPPMQTQPAATRKHTSRANTACTQSSHTAHTPAPSCTGSAPARCHPPAAPAWITHTVTGCCLQPLQPPSTAATCQQPLPHASAEHSHCCNTHAHTQHPGSGCATLAPPDKVCHPLPQSRGTRCMVAWWTPIPPAPRQHTRAPGATPRAVLSGTSRWSPCLGASTGPQGQKGCREQTPEPPCAHPGRHLGRGCRVCKVQPQRSFQPSAWALGSLDMVSPTVSFSACTGGPGQQARTAVEERWALA